LTNVPRGYIFFDFYIVIRLWYIYMAGVIMLLLVAT